ncbi:MAG: hypothetical protein JW750_02205 [Anaerolineaceae bacterium]|nr:hypothetical protein [Anaerolineaceae bacterium]
MMRACNQRLIEKLLESKIPEIQVKLQRDVLGKAPRSAEVRDAQEALRCCERVKRMLDLWGADGMFRDHPYQKWAGSHWVLARLADLGYPAGDTALNPLREAEYQWLLGVEHQRAIRKLLLNGLQRRCASQEGYAVYAMTRLGFLDERVDVLVNQLRHWQWPDGGWNCDKNPEARHSSFMETLIPLRGLIAYSKATGHEEVMIAAREAAEIFLKRQLLYRQHDGSLIRSEFAKLHYPCYWHFDYLFGLKVMAEGGWIDDPRCEPALDRLELARLGDDGFPAEAKYYHHSPDRSGYEKESWGGTSKRSMNPYVSVDALIVLRAAGRI